MRVTLYVIATMLATFAAALGGAVPAGLLLDRHSPLFAPVATFGVAAVAVLLVLLWRRLLHRPWSGVGLGWSRRSIPQALLGVVVAAAALGLGGVLLLALGVSRWTSPPPVDLGELALGIVAAMLVGQAFPEELLWRGNLYDLLTERMPRWAVLAVTAVCFGALHIFSQSPAEGVPEHLLYVAQAIALGFLCGAARARTGALWAAIGVHLGFHLMGIVPLRPSSYAVHLAVMAIMMVLAGCALLVRTPRVIARGGTPNRPAAASGR